MAEPTDGVEPEAQAPTPEQIAGIYRAAVEVAKAEFDDLYPEHERIKQRIQSLRNFICSGSALTGRAVEEIYTHFYESRKRAEELERVMGRKGKRP